MSEVTQILAAVRSGESGAEERLAARVYEELRKMASARMAGEQRQDSLVPTALAHEAWMRLVGGRASDFSSRAHFFGACAEAMRRILVERARKRHRLRHGGAYQRIPFEDLDVSVLPKGSDILDLDEALTSLAEEAPRAARLVELRTFGGLGQSEAARALDVSRATADRDWAYARAFLFDALSPHNEDADA